jgi:hypothetical protein
MDGEEDQMTVLTNRQQYWLDRLEANVLHAQVRLARGVDTSTFDRRTSAVRGDHELRQRQARLDQALKELNLYRRRIELEDE